LSEAAEVTAVDSSNGTGSGAAETRYPKVIARGQDESIVHYAPKPHQEPDPSTRY
jgi:hypothetical protein